MSAVTIHYTLNRAVGIVYAHRLEGLLAKLHGVNTHYTAAKYLSQRLDRDIADIYVVSLTWHDDSEVN